VRDLGLLHHGAEHRSRCRVLTAIPGVRSAHVEIDPTIFWTPASMTEKGRALLAARRSASLAATSVKPQQWRTQVTARASAG
jgi:metal-sulfur cluster biosynthetic enzyme